MTDETNQETGFEEGFEDAFSVEDASKTGQEEAMEEPESQQQESTPDAGMERRHDEGETGQETEGENPEEKQEEAPERFVVKHNGQELELSREELIANAQKGLDYDRIREDREALRNAREIQVIDRLARQNGMNREEYLQSIEANLQNAAIETREAAYLEQGIDPAAARRLAEAEVKAEMLETAVKTQEQERQERDSFEAKMKQDIEEFDRLYPDVKELPPEVIDEISSTGKTPAIAYGEYLLRQKEKEIMEKEAELERVRQEEKNKNTTPGSVKGNSNAQPDPFTAGFDMEL